jgi:hypothetical protein
METTHQIIFKYFVEGLMLREIAQRLEIRRVTDPIVAQERR